MRRDLFSRVSGVVYGDQEGEIPMGVYPGPKDLKIDYRGSMLGTISVPIFVCPIDGERKVVYYYDPAYPPLCSQKHLMEPARLEPVTDQVKVSKVSRIPRTSLRGRHRR